MTTISYLTRIEFDFGALSRIAEILGQLGVSRPLVVTDPGLVKLGLADRLMSYLVPGAALYDDTPANPTEAAVMDATALFRQAGCDGVVALGGGSSIDLAKGVRLLSGHEPPLAQYALIEGGLARIHARIVPMVAIPTTAGTGAEVGRAAVLNLADGRKVGVISPHMIPSVALCDPELTLGLPPFLTAATGMDALSHCLETFWSAAINPPADAIALDGLQRIHRALPRAVADGSDRQARWDMMMGSVQGALAFQKGLGAIHSLTHSLGAIKTLNLHHGTLNAILAPAVARFNREVMGWKWDHLSQLLGGPLDQALGDVNRKIGIPAGLGALGVTTDHIPAIVDGALRDHCHRTNPRIATAEDYVRLIEETL